MYVGGCSHLAAAALGAALGGSGLAAEWLVVAVGVESAVADDLAGGGVDDGDAQVVDQDPHGVAVVLVAESDVVQASAVAPGDSSAGDLVVADAPVPVAAGGGGFGAGGVDLGRGAPDQGPMLPGVVGGVGERVELGWEFVQGLRGRLGA